MTTMTTTTIDAREVPDLPHSCFSSLDSYLRHHIPEMAARIRTGLSPLFDIERDGLPQPIAEMLTERMKPYPAQAITVAGAAAALKKFSIVFVNGEMGTGKSAMAAWLLRMMALEAGRPIRAVVTCPNQLPKKWRAHFLKIIPGCKVVIVNHYTDLFELRRAGKPTQNEVWILPRDKSKLGYSFRLAVIRRMVPVVFPVWSDELRRVVPMKVPTERFFCPQCGKTIQAEKDGKIAPVDASWFGKKKLAKRNCPECNEPLWQANNGFGGCRIVNGRWQAQPHDPDIRCPGTSPRKCAPAEYIGRQKLNFDCYIADEVHELKGMTLQGQMFATIAKRSRKVLPLTGTLVGGYAANLLHILWRSMPQRLIRDGLVHSEAGYQEFERRYGVLREETVYVKKTAYQSDVDLQLGRGKVQSSSTKSLPGISPLMFTKFLVAHSVFIKLSQMHASLPPFYEHVHQIPMLDSQRLALMEMQRLYEIHCAECRKRGEPVRCWSKVRHCFLRWPDRPWPAQEVTDWSAKVGHLHVFDVPELSQAVEYPKELRLRRLISRELRQGRRVWLATELTGDTWDVTGRLVGYLAQHGIRATVLRSQQQGGPKPENREEWIAKQSADVIISNPNLVKTGLDLYDFPTIIFAFCGDSTYTLRQMSRRAWRLGQQHDCHVHYLVYSGKQCRRKGVKRDPEQYQCLQAAALSLMAQKMDAALTLEGDFSAEGLAAMSQSDDIQSKLAKVMAGALQVESPKAVFARYRERLERLMPSIVRERDRVPDPAIVDLAPPVAPPVLPARPSLPMPPVPVAPPPVTHQPRPPSGPTRSGVVRRRSAASAPNLESLFALLDSSAPDIAAKLRADLAAANKGKP